MPRYLAMNGLVRRTKCLRERRLLNLAAANARCANAKPLSGAVYKRVNPLKVHIPTALADLVGMADTMPELRSTAANLTNFCHRNTLPPHTSWADQVLL